MYNDELYHHGILGQKWGIRRYQYEDGSLTPAGQKRYGYEDHKTAKQYARQLNDLDQAIAYNKRDLKELSDKQKKIMKKSKKYLVSDENGNNQYAFPKNSRRAQKLKNKILTNNTKMQEIQGRINQGYDQTSKLIDEAFNNGYTVNSKEISRAVYRGKDYVGVALWGSIPYTMGNRKNIIMKDQNYYKVKKQKKTS